MVDLDGRGVSRWCAVAAARRRPRQGRIGACGDLNYRGGNKPPPAEPGASPLALLNAVLAQEVQ